MVTPRSRMRCRSRGCMLMAPHEVEHRPLQFGCGTWAYSAASRASIWERRMEISGLWEQDGREPSHAARARWLRRYGLRRAAATSSSEPTLAFTTHLAGTVTLAPVAGLC